MTKNGTPPERVVCLREDWPHVLSHHCQAIAGEAACTELLMVRLLAERLLYSLPSAANPVERLFLRQQLMEFSLRWGTEIHKAFHTGNSSACSFNPANLVLDVWGDRSTDPLELFRRWSIRFVDDFERNHVSHLAIRARTFIDAHFADREITRGLAKELRCTASYAAAEFRKAFGISPSQYQRRLRLWEGLRLLRATDIKISSVARTVGFRSAKNFYQMTREGTGRTPTEVRKKRGGK